MAKTANNLDPNDLGAIGFGGIISAFLREKTGGLKAK
jgi:hypothetical protein